MDTTAEDARRKAWSSYWAGGALHSCAGSYEGNYAGAIARFWKSHFQSLKPGSRVLDLATGNGALPLLLWQCTEGRQGIRTDAVDLAQVAPAWHEAASQPSISFHSGVAMEQLPFPDSTFDLVVSQYGLEYARWPEALHESARVGKPEGSAAFVMHHSDSVLVRVGRQELKNQTLLLEEGGLLDAARDVMPWIALARGGAGDLQGDSSAADCKQRYNLAMNRLALEIEASSVPDLLVETRAWVHGLLTGIGAEGAGPQLSMLADHRQAMESAALRTVELVEHAVDEERACGLLEVFRAARPSHQFSCEPIAQEEGILGWGIAMRPGIR